MIMGYIIVILFCVCLIGSLLFSNSGKASKTIYTILGILIVVLSIFIDKTELPDYAAYVAYLRSDYALIEPSFIAIRWIVNSIFAGEPIFLFAIYIILGVSVKLYSINQITDLILLSLMLYICSYWTYHELIQIRAGAASSFVLLSIKPLCDRDKKRFLLICIIAITFHYSAIMMLLFWFIKNNISKVTYVIYLFIIPLSMLLYIMDMDLIDIVKYVPIPIIQEKIISYSSLTAEAANRGLISAADYNPFITWNLIKVIVVYYIWFNVNSIISCNRYALLLLKIQTLGLSLLWLFGSIPVIATRCSEFITVVQIILIPMSIYTIKQRRVGYIIPSLYSIVWMIWNITSFSLI